MTASSRPRPVLLAILDGYGENPHTEHNAVAQAKTPVLENLKAHFPHGVINASELHVGLPEGQMGNSEVGHMNIGSGRVLMQELPKIDHAIASGALKANPKLAAFIGALKASGGTAHVMGLFSPGGVHSHQRHMAELVSILQAAGIRVLIHAFLDGRDTPPQSALEYSAAFRKDCPQGQFATVSGRYYAMDRDNRWDRVERAYRAIVSGEGAHAASLEAAITASYENNKSDEFLLPAVIDNYKGMQDGDGLLMINFRADRVREILSALLDPAFKGFVRTRKMHFAATLGMVDYSGAHNQWMASLFSPEPLNEILGEIIAKQGLTQLRIAETEKYAHVTFFFNGGREEPFAGESRILVPSPQVATYDLKPEMSAFEITDRLVAAIEEEQFDFIVVNFANTDMVGHTGNLQAAITAVEVVDSCIGRIWKALERKDGAMILTADHGNAESMHDGETGQAHTAHTLNLVPVILAVPVLKNKQTSIREGRLADIAPTVLKLMGIVQPKEMTGRSLI
jgi:2,3-bisphosphoglycerate-independent phosphoglycerate mutase